MFDMKTLLPHSLFARLRNTANKSRIPTGVVIISFALAGFAPGFDGEGAFVTGTLVAGL